MGIFRSRTVIGAVCILLAVLVCFGITPLFNDGLKAQTEAVRVKAEGLKEQFGVDVPKQKLVLEEPIKAFGSYQVKAKLGFEVNGTVYVSVYEEK